MHITLFQRTALRLSDNCLVRLIPTYRQKLKSTKPVVKSVKRWTNETEWVLQAHLNLTDWSIFETAANDLDELTDCHFVYPFLWGHVHSYKDSFNLQQWQTMVHCKTDSSVSSKKMLTGRGIKSCINRPNTHWKRRSEKQMALFHYMVRLGSAQHGSVQVGLCFHCS